MFQSFLQNVRVKPEKVRSYENVKAVLLDIGQGGFCCGIVNLQAVTIYKIEYEHT